MSEPRHSSRVAGSTPAGGYKQEQEHQSGDLSIYILAPPPAPDQLPGITPVFRYDEGQYFSISHWTQSGFLALQIFRPW